MNMVIDCDGVLTDGKLYMAASGEKMFKAFHTRDVRALREFVARGFYVCIVTADSWGGIAHFAEKVGVDLLVMRDKKDIVKKLKTIDIGIGDDAWDVPFLKEAKHKFVPQDCHKSVRDIPGVVRLQTKSGEGVISEVLDYLLLFDMLKPL